MNFEELIAKALSEDLENDIAMYNSMPDHHFSFRFKRKMKKLISESKRLSEREHHSERELPSEIQKSPKLNLRHLGFQKALAIALIIFMSVFITGITYPRYYIWDCFVIEDKKIYSILDVTNIENVPFTIQEHYCLGVSTEGYDTRVMDDDEYDYWVIYRNPQEKKSFSFMQSVKNPYGTVWINTENARVQPTEVTINDYKGLYFETHYGEKCYILDSGDYVFDIAAYGFSKDELTAMAESVHKVE